MMLMSCVNCCHNPLQTDSLGTSVGYCTEHHKVLLAPTQLTCGRHLRKDLVRVRAAGQRSLHERRFSPSAVVRLTNSATPANGGYTSDTYADVKELGADQVGAAILDYGRLQSKIGSLAQLRWLRGTRPELAFLSLGRAYIDRCSLRGGPWTSGLHLFWWTRDRLLETPEVAVPDLRIEGAVPLARQVALAQWSVIMMRVIFISDVGAYARSHDRKMAKLANFADLAAEGAASLSPKRLLTWLKRHGSKLVDEALSESRYEKLAVKVREEAAED